MKSISAYLTFNGNCKEAMIFYQKCLGGSLSLQTIGESPIGCKMPVRMKKYILTGILQNNHLIISGTDLVLETGLIKGNNFALLLQCSTTTELEKTFTLLSKGGDKIQLPNENFYGIFVGTLKDKYGIHWVLQA